MSMGMVDLFGIWMQLEALWTDRARTEGDKRRSGGREQRLRFSTISIVVESCRTS
jgi:hypothetical protein